MCIAVSSVLFMALFREVAVEKKEKKVNIDRLGNRNGIGEKPGPGNGCHAINAPRPTTLTVTRVPATQEK